MDRETKQFLRGVGIFSAIVAIICLIGNKVGGAQEKAGHSIEHPQADIVHIPEG